MSASIQVVALSAVLGGVLGGGLVHILSTEAESEAQRPRAEKARETRQVEVPIDEDDESKLADRVRTLEHRIALVTTALQKNQDTGSSDADLDGSVDARTGESADVADPVFEAAVLDIVDRERERKDEEEVAWRKKLQTERGRRLAMELTSSLELNAQQQTEIAQAITDYFDQVRALREDPSLEQPATRKERREQRDRMNQAADDKLRQILSPEQFAKYEALSPDEKVGFGRRSSITQQDNQATH